MLAYLLPSLNMVAGLVLLVVGGEFLVRGATALAIAARVSPLVIGLTVVAYGTSSPELAVSVQAALTGQAEIAVGNVVGSNICNVLLILGLSAVISPLLVASQLIRFDVPLMIVVSLLLLAFGLNGNISRVEGMTLFAGSVLYTIWTIVQSRRETAAVEREFADNLPIDRSRSRWHIATRIGLIAAGFLLLGLGANWLVHGATTVAGLLGVSPLITGLTIVAVGTSLPELFTSLLAAIRGARDIAVGNVIGSNIFNILAVLGLSSAVSTTGIEVSPEALRFDIPVMIAVAIACLPICLTGNTITRWEGGLLLLYYAAYIALLIVDVLHGPSAHRLAMAILTFVIPLTLIPLLVSLVRHFRRARKTASL